MTLVVKQDEVSNVVDVRLFGFEAEMLQADGCSNLIEQTRWLRLGHGDDG